MISVLLPVKNGGEYLFSALESLHQQTYQDFECIIIDDASNDGACDTITEQFDDRFRVIGSDGTGIIDALNTGLTLSTRPLIARMDADDIALDTRFEQQVDFLETNKGIDFCGCKIEYFSNSKKIDQGLSLYQDWINSQVTHTDICRNMFIECALPHPSFMLRRSLIDKIGAYQDNGWAEDYDLVLRAYIHKARFGKPKEILLQWRDHYQRLSRNDERYQKRNFIDAKAYYFARSPIYQSAKKHHKKLIIWGAGKTGKMLLKKLLANNVTVDALVEVSPKLIGTNINEIPINNAMDFDYQNCFVLIAVSKRGVRQMIEEHLAKQLTNIDVLAMA